MRSIDRRFELIVADYERRFVKALRLRSVAERAIQLDGIMREWERVSAPLLRKP